MDPAALEKFEQEHKDDPGVQLKKSEFDHKHNPLWDLDENKLYMVINTEFDNGRVGKFEPKNVVSTEFGREDMGRGFQRYAMRHEPSSLSKNPWFNDTGEGYTERVDPDNSKIYELNTTITGGRRRKTRRRMIKKRRRTRSKRKSLTPSPRPS